MMNRYAVSVIGLGYVGLPLASLLAENHDVTGFDVDSSRINDLQNSNLPVDEPGLPEYFISGLKNKSLKLTANPHEIRKTLIKIVTVGTPYLPDKNSIDTSQLSSALEIVVPELKNGDVLLLKSTVPPGTTSGFVRERIEKQGFNVPGDIGVAFAPERMIEGQAIQDFKTLPKIIGATDDKTYSIVSELLSSLGGKIIKVSNPETAEMAKMLDNYSRYVFLALTNELALVSEKIGVDVLELINASKADYPRNSGLLLPGPGVGGSCLNKDPFILRAEMAKSSLNLKMVGCSQEVNNYMPIHVADLVKKYAGRRNNVVLLGVSFKEDTNDTRFTPCFTIEGNLKKDNFKVKLSDPFVAESNIIRDPYEAAKDSDIIVILTKHSAYKNLDLKKLNKIMKENPLIIDTRGLFDRGTAASLGFEYHGVGRL
jgi:UDP-N-acetyl-D-mannosaminuronic acid dehydrogenase